MPDPVKLEIFRHSLESIIEEDMQPGLERFYDNHRELYGYAMSEEPIELVTLRLAGTVSTERVTSQLSTLDQDPVETSRDVFFDWIRRYTDREP